jgi:hypothetical protein
MKNLYHSSWPNVATAFGLSVLTLLGLVSLLLFPVVALYTFFFLYVVLLFIWIFSCYYS